MEAPAQIRESILRELIQAGSTVYATVIGQEKGFALEFRVGIQQKILVTSRGQVRLFASLDTAGTFVRDLGLPQFSVDMASHQPGRLRKPRPDRAEALRHTRTRMQQQPLSFSL